MGVHDQSLSQFNNRGSYKHGGFLRRKATPEYASWQAMRNRCSNLAFKNYAGRGIKVCERWNDFSCFRDDMGPRPHGAQLDRIDPNGNYEPSNCRWVTQADNLRNRRNCRYVSLNGKKMTLAEAIREIGANEHTVRARVRRGWSVATALFA